MEKIYLGIAGFNLLFKLHHTEKLFHMEKFEKMLRTDYREFIETKKQKIDFTFHIDYMGTVFLNIKKDKHTKNKNYKISTFNINEKSRALNIHNPPSSSDFEFIVNTVLNKYLMPSGKSFTIHGSAVSYGNNAYLFEGRPGAGKSTTTQLLDGFCNILVDDSMIIRKVNNKFYLYQTIIHEKNYKFKKTNKPFLIDKVFFIKKAEKCSVKEIKNKNTILKKMLKQIYTYEEEFNKQFKILTEFVNETKFYELYIKKDEKIFKEFFKKGVLKI